MAIERNDNEERQARLDQLVTEFRVARERRLAKLDTALWQRTDTEARHAAARAAATALDPTKH